MLEVRKTVWLHHLGQVGGLANPIHPTEGHGVGAASLLSLHHISENVQAPLGGKELHQGLSEGVADSGGDALEGAKYLSQDENQGWHKIKQLTYHHPSV